MVFLFVSERNLYGEAAAKEKRDKVPRFLTGIRTLRSQRANKGERLKFALPLGSGERHLPVGQNGKVSPSAKA